MGRAVDGDPDLGPRRGTARCLFLGRFESGCGSRDRGGCGQGAARAKKRSASDGASWSRRVRVGWSRTHGDYPTFGLSGRLGRGCDVPAWDTEQAAAWWREQRRSIRARSEETDFSAFEKTIAVDLASRRK